ncbi:MAG: hypothetical protein M3445_04235 [Actinomycetota bacterium]|nr:hypothetical protein [Actinomycetota bacterium]
MSTNGPQRPTTNLADSRDQAAPAPPRPWMPPNAGTTPNAERYLLEADALRRRQLRSALLHGSGRTWRDNRRIWPGVVAGIVVVAVILASFAVAKAIANKKKDDAELEQQEQSVSAVSKTRVPPDRAGL